jgi:multidrug efflux pump subunit AcrA (membrane-fusion protein)
VERGQNGNYVYRIKPDDTVEVCPVTVRHVDEGVAIIADGVAAGDRIVVDGQFTGCSPALASSLAKRRGQAVRDRVLQGS